MHATTPAFRTRRRGQAMVEFGLVFPILIITLMAIIEFGLLLREYLAVNFMLTEAAKEASLLRDVSDPDVRVIRKMLQNSGGLDPARLTINLFGGGSAGPFALEGTAVLDTHAAVVAQPSSSLFFLSDNGTSGDTSDDAAAQPGVSTGSYARLSVSYLHHNYGPYPDFMGITEFTFTQTKTVRLE